MRPSGAENFPRGVPARKTDGTVVRKRSWSNPNYYGLLSPNVGCYLTVMPNRRSVSHIQTPEIRVVGYSSDLVAKGPAPSGTLTALRLLWELVRMQAATTANSLPPKPRSLAHRKRLILKGRFGQMLFGPPMPSCGSSGAQA